MRNEIVVCSAEVKINHCHLHHLYVFYFSLGKKLVLCLLFYHLLPPFVGRRLSTLACERRHLFQLKKRRLLSQVIWRRYRWRCLRIFSLRSTRVLFWCVLRLCFLKKSYGKTDNKDVQKKPVLQQILLLLASLPRRLWNKVKRGNCGRGQEKEGSPPPPFFFTSVKLSRGCIPLRNTLKPDFHMIATSLNISSDLRDCWFPWTSSPRSSRFPIWRRPCRLLKPSRRHTGKQEDPGDHGPPKLTTRRRTWLLLASGVVLRTDIYKSLYGM